MLNIINLPSLAERRLHTRLVMMYKVSFHLVAVPSDIYSFRHKNQEISPLNIGKYILLRTHIDIQSSHTQYHSATNSL
jgi:hypothetical protein